MYSSFLGARLDGMLERWWVPVLRGLAAIAFGVLAFVSPGISLFALMLVWGGYAFVNGTLDLILAVQAGRAGARFGWYIVEGLVSIAAGVITFVYPHITALALLLVIAIWAIATGLLEIASAIQLRRMVPGEWTLALAGVLTVVFGVLLLVHPQPGALALVWLIGAYAIVFGVLLIGLGLRLHRLHRGAARGVPPGITPREA